MSSLGLADDVRVGLTADDGQNFHAVIEPHRALSLTQIVIVSGVVLATSLGFQAFFIAQGAWPVSVFAGVEALLVIGGLIYFCVAQSRQEIVAFSGGDIVVERFRLGAVVERRRLPAFGVRIERRDDPDYGCQSLIIASRGRSLEVARDLSPDERLAFCRALVDSIRGWGGSPIVIITTSRGLREPDEEQAQ